MHRKSTSQNRLQLSTWRVTVRRIVYEAGGINTNVEKSVVNSIVYWNLGSRRVMADSASSPLTWNMKEQEAGTIIEVRCGHLSKPLIYWL